MLSNTAPFSIVCEFDNECYIAASTMEKLCVADLPGDWVYYDDCRSDNAALYTDGVGDIPGASMMLYVYGWDAYGNRLTASEFEISIEDGDTATSVTDAGQSAGDNQYYYYAPFVISIGKTDESDYLVISDEYGVAPSIAVSVAIEPCDPGYYQDNIYTSTDDNSSASVFTCTLCDAQTYTLKTDKCKGCEQGLTCYGGDEIEVAENWYCVLKNHDLFTLDAMHS